MHRRRRRLLMLRRSTRWTLTILLAVVLSLEIASVWWTLCWQWGDTFENQVRITIERGACGARWLREEESLSNPTPAFLIRDRPGLTVRHADDPGWGFRTGWSPPFTWRACGFGCSGNDWSWAAISFPLAWAVLALAVPTGWLWLGELQRHRRIARAGRCRNCGYDLGGLEHLNKEEEEESGGEEGPRQPQRRRPRCPECGEDLEEAVGERAESAGL